MTQKCSRVALVGGTSICTSCAPCKKKKEKTKKLAIFVHTHPVCRISSPSPAKALSAGFLVQMLKFLCRIELPPGARQLLFLLLCTFSLVCNCGDCIDYCIQLLEVVDLPRIIVSNQLTSSLACLFFSFPQPRSLICDELSAIIIASNTYLVQDPGFAYKLANAQLTNLVASKL